MAPSVALTLFPLTKSVAKERFDAAPLGRLSARTLLGWSTHRELLRAPFGMRHLLLLITALMLVWALCVAVRRISEPATMTADKWLALRVLSSCSPRAMSASEIARESRGYLSAFMLALQLRQLEGFGLVQRWDRSTARNHDTVYDLTPAGKALLAGVARLDQFGILRLNEEHARCRVNDDG